MNNNLKISDLILQLEENEDLFKWQIQNVFVWEIIRVKLFLRIQELSVSESYGENENHSFLKIMKRLIIRIVKNCVFRNPFLSFKRKDVLLFESGRKYLYNDTYIDIYTYFIESKIKKDKKSIECYETNFLYDSVGASRKFHNDFISIFSKGLSKFIGVNFSRYDLDQMAKIENYILKTANLDIKLEKIISEEIKLFSVQNFFYGRLLDLRKPKEIYFVNYLNYFALVNQAKKRNIKVIELQHGLIIRDALMYHFPHCIENSLKYFPTYFLLWKGFSGVNGKLPLSRKYLIEHDFNHLENIKSTFSYVKREDKSILVASQPFFSNRIITYILKNAPLMENYLFYYKLHPMQFDNFFENPSAIKLLNIKNVKIIKNELSVYELLSKCKYTIGIYSTVLFEASIFNSKPLLLLTDETKYASSLIENNEGTAISEQEQLLQILEL